jgi:hypothetical protein
MRLFVFKRTRPPISVNRIRERRLPSQLSGLTAVKTLDGRSVSGPPALFFIRELRNYLEGFGFLICNRHRLAPLRRDHVVDSTS